MPITPKSFKQIMDEYVSHAMQSTDLKDIENGSILNSMLEIEGTALRSRLVRFLAKLDTRFKKHQDPWDELKVAQMYFGKL